MKITARKDGPIIDLLVDAFGLASKTHIRKILKYNMIQVSGQPVTRAADLHQLIPEMPKGRDVSLTYVRNGQERDALVRL